MSSSWPGNHPDDLLSALVDGELTADDAAAVEAHVGSCESCRADVEAVRSVRDLVRGLAAVDAPFGFYERVLRNGPAPSRRPSRRSRFGVGNVAAAAAAWLVVIGVGSMGTGTAVASASVAELVSVHDRTASRPLSSPSPEARQALGVPSSLAGTYELVAILDGEQTQAVYSDGERTVSVFVVPGRLDGDAVRGARTAVVNGLPAWDLSTAATEVVLLQRPGVVVVVVGSAWPEALVPEVAAAQPHVADDPSISDNLSRACRELLRTFGLRG
ncbi:MAG TPA: zf-HC2 domain-containing protein [Acidimicrobiales bacterium]